MRQLCKFLEAGRTVRLTVAFQPGTSYSAQELPRKAVLAEAVNTVGMAAWADPSTLRTAVSTSRLQYAAPAHDVLPCRVS